jgi:hypothetical protein
VGFIQLKKRKKKVHYRIVLLTSLYILAPSWIASLSFGIRKFVFFLVGLGKNSLEDTCLESDGYKRVSASDNCGVGYSNRRELS